jgi:hypothetical protein
MDTSTPLPPAASAWYDWFDSEEGVRCSDIRTLRAPDGDPRHLEDRLRFALMAGYRAARAAEDAAPDLLEALRPFANYACDEPHVDEPECHNCRARAAIARAMAPTPDTEAEHG